ncbi:MAG: 2-oxoacid:acceptor oxidoreductase family protein [Deltaproteobacteria bacterium]|nr:2-oxoacid:acceptor oxidoreductase family protein [Deltaproteobacteria bacterium]
MKTASRILGSAFFREGFEVQDAPRYGAERRGAPIFAYVRAAREPIHERGVITRPDLVVVADDSLVSVAAAGVLVGASARTVMLICSNDDAAVWRERLGLDGPVFTLACEPAPDDEVRFLGAASAGAASRFTGVIGRESLEHAIREELQDLRPEAVERNVGEGLTAFDEMEAHAGCLSEGTIRSAEAYEDPNWVELPFEGVEISAPDIHGAATSVQVRTGLWRTMRPVIDYDRCNRCSWICTTFCPDSAIHADADRTPRIDYDNCKGCLVCVAVCPPHAIAAVPEQVAVAADSEEAST